jgi:hypothetical protein
MDDTVIIFPRTHFFPKSYIDYGACLVNQWHAYLLVHVGHFVMVDHNICTSLNLETAVHAFLKHRTRGLLCALYMNALLHAYLYKEMMESSYQGQENRCTWSFCQIGCTFGPVIILHMMAWLLFSGKNYCPPVPQIRLPCPIISEKHELQ